ncbi:MEKHLA domain-containing protein [Cyanobium sp. CH-040]|uniref:MEKHLA domain-containing protein n=1 Tax=Cyanobium sp. CH-040 TaxID=2823708 RepID=UPI0020CEB7FD|nr:MEKHLA domain-containing protein [Cyanobium sp. CH-040]MCP9928291.1 MEKHLA domain-containing protein [Cyanobium sp. CH-040]
MVPSPPPWLVEPRLTLARRILESHLAAYAEPLLPGLNADSGPEHRAQTLFAAPVVVLAHDGEDPGGDPGPRLTYANRAALRLWRRTWAEMVGLPSRLTAPAAERAERRLALLQARAGEAIEGYSGIRVDSRGRRFRIGAARVWTLHDAEGRVCGQAARFSAWWWLRDPS